MSVELCPVCMGKGAVPGNFYTFMGPGNSWPSTVTGTETCRACGGVGVFRDTEDVLRERVAELENELSLYVGLGNDRQAKKSRKVLLKGERRFVSIEARIEQLETLVGEMSVAFTDAISLLRKEEEKEPEKHPMALRAALLEEVLIEIFFLADDIDTHNCKKDGPQSGVIAMGANQIMKRIKEIVPSIRPRQGQVLVHHKLKAEKLNGDESELVDGEA